MVFALCNHKPYVTISLLKLNFDGTGMRKKYETGLGRLVKDVF
jgi:hypothetical protein